MNLILSLLLSLPACLTRAVESRPDWLSGKSASYPKNSHILGIGESGSQEKAADKARAEIAKAFSLTLSARTKSTAREIAGGNASRYTEEISDDVRTATAKVLDGVEIAEYWADGKGDHYALAVLNRVHALKILTDKLSEMDAEFVDISTRMAKSDGKFARLNYALKLVENARSRKKLNADYRVLNSEGKGTPAPEDSRDVLSEARKAVLAVSITVEASGAYGSELTRRIIRGLSDYGLRVSEKNARTADVIVETTAAGENLPAENLLWFWAKATLKSSLSYGSTGEVFKRLEVSSSQADRDPEGALAKTLASAADQSAARIHEAITSGELLDD